MSPGPPPKRDDERRRRNAQPIETMVLDLADMESQAVTAPAPNEKWHPAARLLWDGLCGSVVARLYEPSDWATAYTLVEDYSRELAPRMVEVGRDGNDDPIFVETEMPMPGAKLNALLKGLSSLMAAEGDRRRLQIEVKRAGQAAGSKESQSAAGRVSKERRMRLVKDSDTA